MPSGADPSNASVRLSLVLFIGTIVFFVLFFAGSSIFEWYDHDKVIHSKEAWLNVPFFVGRNVVLFLFAAWLASLYIKNSVRPDIGLARENRKLLYEPSNRRKEINLHKENCPKKPTPFLREHSQNQKGSFFG